jgi:hypothetical protein
MKQSTLHEPSVRAELELATSGIVRYHHVIPVCDPDLTCGTKASDALMNAMHSDFI